MRIIFRPSHADPGPGSGDMLFGGGKIGAPSHQPGGISIKRRIECRGDRGAASNQRAPGYRVAGQHADPVDGQRQGRTQWRDRGRCSGAVRLGAGGILIAGETRARPLPGKYGQIGAQPCLFFRQVKPHLHAAQTQTGIHRFGNHGQPHGISLGPGRGGPCRGNAMARGQAAKQIDFPLRLGAGLIKLVAAWKAQRARSFAKRGLA